MYIQLFPSRDAKVNNNFTKFINPQNASDWPDSDHCHILLLPARQPEANQGVAPRDYIPGDDVPIYVNALSSDRSLVNYDYYYPSFKFCKPDGGPVSQRESLGAILFGDRLFTSAFKLNALTDVACQELCTTLLEQEDTAFIAEKLKEEFVHNWMIDGLPAAQKFVDSDTKQTFYIPGFPLGEFTADGQVRIDNHFNFIIHFHRHDNTRLRIVGFEVDPISVADTFKAKNCALVDTPPKILQPLTKSISYTYSVTWKEDHDIAWATRWDNYLHVFDPQIQWFSIINSIVIVLILASMLTVILLRTVYRDIARYNTITALTEEEGNATPDDFGWKMIHAGLI